jgi:high-affinity K+ transport system ATPase subunit B
LKIFGWYIGTEPLREIKSLYKAIRRLLVSLNKLVTIAYVSLILAVISVYTQKKLLAATLFCLLFFVVLFSEWQSGAFIARHREAVREKLRKEMEKNPERAYIDDKKKEEDDKLIGGK